jgi:hypothetical protein
MFIYKDERRGERRFLSRAMAPHLVGVGFEATPLVGRRTSPPSF